MTQTERVKGNYGVKFDLFSEFFAVLTHTILCNSTGVYVVKMSTQTRPFKHEKEEDT